jgi:hypothetical protein
MKCDMEHDWRATIHSLPLRWAPSWIHSKHDNNDQSQAHCQSTPNPNWFQSATCNYAPA